MCNLHLLSPHGDDRRQNGIHLLGYNSIAERRYALVTVGDALRRRARWLPLVLRLASECGPCVAWRREVYLFERFGIVFPCSQCHFVWHEPQSVIRLDGELSDGLWLM